MPKCRRKEIAKIEDQRSLRVTFSKRRPTLFKRLYELGQECDARAAAIVFSNTGKLYTPDDSSLYSSCGSSLKQIIFDYWVEKECDYCKTEEDFDSLIVKYQDVLDCVRKKLKDVSGGGDSRVEHFSDSKVDEDFDSLYENLKSDPILFSLIKAPPGNCDSFLTLPVNSATCGGSSGAKSTPMRSALESCAYNAAGGGSSGVKSIPTGSHFEDCGFDPDDDGGRGSSLILPENAAISGGSSGEKPTHSNPEYRGYDPEDFAGLEDFEDLHF